MSGEQRYDRQVLVRLAVDQFDALKAIARHADRSVAWVVRQAVDAYLSEEKSGGQSELRAVTPVTWWRRNHGRGTGPWIDIEHTQPEHTTP